ncbi:hypothetical protein AUP68_08897 [Ilyonectria robusta]
MIHGSKFLPKLSYETITEPTPVETTVHTVAQTASRSRTKFISRVVETLVKIRLLALSNPFSEASSRLLSEAAFKLSFESLSTLPRTSHRHPYRTGFRSFVRIPAEYPSNLSSRPFSKP